jgi:sugar phosphate isomerase/epimerase/HEAT repeat protein
VKEELTMKSWTRVVIVVLVVAVGCWLASPALAAAKAKDKAAAPAAAPAAPESPKPANLDEAFAQLKAYQFGQSREALTMIADAVRDSHANAAERAKLVKRLITMLGAADTTQDGRRFICRQLSIAGTAESVPALAALLPDKDLSDMGRYALERIPDPAALAAMRDALAKASGKIKIGLINSLGDRCDAASTAAIIAALGDADATIASCAAAALGKIGGPDALKALQAAKVSAKPEVKPVVVDSLLLCADRLLADKKVDEASAIYQEMYKPAEAKHIRTAALRGLVAAGGDKATALLTEILSGTDPEMQASALRFMRETSGPGSAKTLAAMLPKCPVAAQALLLDDLGARGDPSTLSAVLPMVKNPDVNVRLAAVRAVGKLGDASALPLLMPMATGAAGPEQDEARRALDRLPGADVNPALLKAAQAPDPGCRTEALRALGARRAEAAVPVALKAAEDADANVRTAALGALDALADEKSAPAMVSLLAKAKDDAGRTAAEKAVASLCSRIANKDVCVNAILGAMGGADMPSKCALIRVLGRAGGAKALAEVRKCTKDATPEIQDAAIRSLTTWADSAAAPDLLEIAKTSANAKHQVLALQGYIRLARESADIQPPQKLKMFQEALAAAKRPDEKTQVLAGLADQKSVAALKMIVPCLDDAALAAPAAAAAVKVAKNVVGSAKDDVRTAMTKVLEVTKDANVKKDAADLLKQAGGAPAPAPAKTKTKTAKAPLVRVYNAPAEGKKAKAKAAPPAAPAPITVPIKKVDLSAAEALGWRLGFQAYTFRALSFFETVDLAAAMGLKCIEIFPGQKLSPDKPDVKTGPGMSDDDIAAMKKKVESAGIKIVNMGVIGLGKDEASARKVFDFAKKVGIETIVSEATEDTFDLLDKLTEEYKINIALHNHPKPSHYWDAETVLKGVEGHSKRIGSDSDTGHWMRSGLNPLECLKKLQGRIISLHFKDLNAMGGGAERPQDVPWGTGVGNAKGMLEELKRQGFKGVFSIEYESGSGDELVSNVNKCVEWFAATAAELGKK